MPCRCCICGRKLTADVSVARGIGPICNGKQKEAALLGENRPDDANCKKCGGNLTYTPMFDKLKLPCNNYCCTKNHCPFARESVCPRERVLIKSDIYPLYKNKEKHCSFCGKQLNGYRYRMHTSKSKITLECTECREKNQSWRNNISIKIPRVNHIDNYLINQEKYRI